MFAAILSLLIGTAPIGQMRLFAALAGHGDRIAETILFELRLPRMLLGLAVGAMLGLAGATLQGYLRNPLAEPSVLGASNASSLGAVGALYFGLADLHPTVLPALSILTGLAALLLLFALAGRSESPLTLVLAGIAVATLAVAGISLALNLSPNPFAAMEITTWLLGSLENRSFDHLWLALPCIVIGAVLLMIDGRTLDALTLGEDNARAGCRSSQDTAAPAHRRCDRGRRRGSGVRGDRLRRADRAASRPPVHRPIAVRNPVAGGPGRCRAADARRCRRPPGPDQQ